ncbi:MAG: DIP1984 family protein [Bacteroidota bacterium]
MKLAEALLLRADLNRKTAQLAQRIRKVATVQEGETPQENPLTLKTALEQAYAELEQTIVRINRANIDIAFDEETSLMAALAKRDVLKAELAELHTIRDAATVTNHRYSTTEIRTVATMDLPALQKEIDDKSKAYRLLDAKIQSLNWTHDA